MRRLLAIVLLLSTIAGQDVVRRAGSGEAHAPVAVEAGDARVSERTVAYVHELAQQGLVHLDGVFPDGLLRPVRMVVHSDAGSLPEALLASLHPGTAGLALLGRDEIHVLLDESVREPPNDLRTVVVHELVHTLLDQHTGEGAPFVPRWVHEGLAQTLSGGPYLGVQEENLLFAIGTRTAFRFAQLEARFPDREDLLRLAYAQSYSFVAFLVDRLGADVIVEAARRCRADRPFYFGLYELTDSSEARFQEEWEEYVLYRSGALSRYLLRNCFSFLMILAVPLLTIAVVKRSRRNRARKDEMAAAETAPQQLARPDEEET